MALVCCNWAQPEPLTAAFRRLWEGDAIFQELWAGQADWGFIDGIIEDTAGYRKVEPPSWADLSTESEPVLVSGVVAKPSAAPLPPPRPQVPAFTVGIKTLIFRNLPRDITVETLRRCVEKYGPVRDIYIPKNMDRASPYFGTIKGFALIKFLQPEDSARAYQEEYGRLTIGKNNITVEFAAADR
jgi:hypothetical protein